MSRGTSNYPTSSNFASNQILLDTRLLPVGAQTQLLASAAAASIKDHPHPPPPPLTVVTAHRKERRAARTNSLSSCFRSKFTCFIFQAAIERKYNAINFTSHAKTAKLSRSKINAVSSKGRVRGRRGTANKKRARRELPLQHNRG